jgi:2-polyprenyl-3-methyl-5-hydroxy-6-metoxy-1,4-benzoquinol methylase
MNKRQLDPEEMDDDGLPPEAHAQALAGLARLNRLSFGSSSIWSALQAAGAFAVGNSRPIRVLDVATGGGDGPVALGLRARRLGIPMEIIGVDRSPFALSTARELADRYGISARWVCLDVTRDPIPAADWITSSLFLHHLTDAQVVSLLRAMANIAAHGIIINDLERSALNRGLVWLGARLVSRSPVVHRDSDRSVRAGFTLREAADLAEAAGLSDMRFERRFPCRFQWIWTKSAH